MLLGQTGAFRAGKGSAPKDPDALTRECPAHRVQLPRFFLARYPVTVAQWRAYYRATGAPEDARSLRGEPTHPVVYVSWHDAVRYCDWLTEALRGRARLEAGRPAARRTVPGPLATLLLRGDGQSGPWVVTLPSEAEWEKAARGDTTWIYPWGNEPDPNRANYWAADETAVEHWTAAGCFRGGASPYGVEDLAGNVWEWTRSERRPYPYDASDGRESVDVPSTVHRVVRGGSFFSSLQFPGSVRSAYRLEYGADSRILDIGFRVVVAPFSLPSDPPGLWRF